MGIRYNARPIERFKRTAREKYPLEHLELLFGRAAGEEIEILKLITIPYYASLDSNDENSCDFKDEDLAALKALHEKDGLLWLGTIHSHTWNDHARPSECDNADAVKQGETVFGIYAFRRREDGRLTAGKLEWWRPQTPVAAEPIRKPKKAPPVGPGEAN